MKYIVSKKLVTSVVLTLLLGAAALELIVRYKKLSTMSAIFNGLSSKVTVAASSN